MGAELCYLNMTSLCTCNIAGRGGESRNNSAMDTILARVRKLLDYCRVGPGSDQHLKTLTLLESTARKMDEDQATGRLVARELCSCTTLRSHALPPACHPCSSNNAFKARSEIWKINDQVCLLPDPFCCSGMYTNNARALLWQTKGV